MEAINGVLDECVRASGINPEQVVQGVIVGNTAMHHLCAGLPVNPLALAPYVPSVGGAIDFHADRIGLKYHRLLLQFLPNIAGYVGADHVAVVLATEIWKSDDPVMVIDIGTNAEIGLAVDRQIFSCSCAPGPAFEGALSGMGCERRKGRSNLFNWSMTNLTFSLSATNPRSRFCGSGILDIVAELSPQDARQPRSVPLWTSELSHDR